MIDEDDEDDEPITSVHGGEPGGGHPGHGEERTQLLGVDDREPAAAISTTARFSAGAPEPLEVVDSAGLTGILPPRPGMPSASAPPTGVVPLADVTEPPTARRVVQPASGKGRTAPPTGGHPIVQPASGKGRTAPPTGGHPFVPPMVGPATVPIAAARSLLPPTGGHPIVPPTGGHPIVPPTGGHPVVSGPHPVVGLTPTGGHPIVPRRGARPRGRAPARGPTAAHPNLRVTDDTTRLAWGFLFGVLITVAILAVVVALALYLMR